MDVFQSAQVAHHLAICYAAIESNIVRSMEETILYILHNKVNKEIQGQFQNAHILVVWV